MPRTRKDNRGGSREGKGGQAYANRSDLTQAPSAGPSQEYGQKTQRLASQQQAPLPASPQPQPGPTTPGAAGGGVDLAALLAGVPSLDAPSMRPGEPLTAGLSTGPGAGPEALAAMGPQRGAGALLRRLLAVDQDPEMFELVALADRAQGGIVPPQMSRALMPPVTRGNAAGTATALAAPEISERRKGGRNARDRGEGDSDNLYQHTDE